MEQKQVLIVDDDVRNIFALKAVLRSRNISCITAGSGSEALELLSHDHRIGIILMDIMMPDMDGYETCRMLREQRPGYDPLIIALSGYALSDYQLQINNTRFDAQLLKPIDLKTLLETIGRLLNTR